ncbi:Gfo/Idh/MocA family oxidoreductase [Candidatus Sumerlaeota bacterium]|nr:Gfo/Idh/MocA family oxidoreductase [Candidatus Sumerlaeota bacterium]
MGDARPIRVGILGLGRAGWGMHCKELDSRTEKFQIVAGCDPDTGRLARMKERYGCATYRTIDELLGDANVDLVSIASRSPEHVEHAIRTLKARKIAFLEKPIALSYAEAKKLRTTVARTKGKLFLRHNRRFEPAFVHIQEIVASKILGNIYEIKLRRHGFQRRNDWQTLIRCGGGQLLNWGPHIIDHALRFLDGPVAEIWSDLKKVAAVGDAEDHVHIILTDKNGRKVDLEISGGAAISEPEYIVFGTRGALTCKGKEIQLKYLNPARKLGRVRAEVASPPMEGAFANAEKLEWIQETIPVGPKTPSSTEGIWDHLYSALRERKKFPVTLEQGLAVMDVISKVKKGTLFEG